MALTTTCSCGQIIEAQDEEQFVLGVNQHAQDKHPDLANQYTREQILAMATEV